LEERIRPLPAGEVELCDLVKFMTFGELCAGQTVLERHGEDPDAAFSDPTLVALVAVARLRRQGVAVAPLFGEAV
jgi:hypothetical protein